MKRKKKLSKFIDHYIVILYMTLLTVYALYFDDIRILVFTKEYDDIFYGITLLGIICFTMEISIASYAKDEYLFSFFFILDIVSTVSMIPDCGWIWSWIMGESADGGGESAAQLAKTSRASRVTRVIRVIRLIRLIRIVKLYKQQQIAKQKANEFSKRKVKKDNKKSQREKKSFDQKIHPGEYDSSSQGAHGEIENEENLEDLNVLSEDEDELSVPDESKISRTLSDKTTRTVVILVLSLLILLQICSLDTYVSTGFVHDQGLEQLVTLHDNETTTNESF